MTRDNFLPRWVHGLLIVVAALVAALVPSTLPALPVFAGNTMAALDTMMKIIYSEPLIRDIVTDSELLDLFEQDSNIQTDQTTGGKWVEMAHYRRLAGAAGARGENDYLPVPAQPAGFNTRIFLRKIIGVVEMTGDVMEKVVGDEGSFLNFMEQALPDTKERVVKEVNRMSAGFGAGIKARVATKPGGNVITVDRSLGVTGFEDAWLQFSEGDRIVFSANPNGAPLRNAGTAQSALVETIDETTGALTLTVDAATYTALQVNDFIFEGDQSGTSAQDGGVNREMQGLLAGVDDGNILAVYNNYNRSTNRIWRSRVFSAAGAPYDGVLTERLLTVCDAATQTAMASKINAIVTSVHAPIGYWDDLRGDRVINDPRSYTGGKGALSILLGDRTLPLRTARGLPPQVAFGLNTSTWRRFSLGTWEWQSRSGSIWTQVVDAVGRRDAHFAYGKMYEELACIRPRANFRIDGLARQFNY